MDCQHREIYANHAYWLDWYYFDIICSIAQPYSTEEDIILNKHATGDMNQCGEMYGIENDYVHNTSGLKCGDESTNHSR